MKIKATSVMWCAAVLGISCTPAFAACPNQDRAYQDRDEVHRHFTDHDRRVLNDWYRDHADRFRSEQGRWNNEDLQRRLQVGNRMDEDLRDSARPVPDEIANRLDPLPPGWQYLRIGYNVVIAERDGDIRDVYRFDQGDQYNDEQRQYNNDQGSYNNGQDRFQFSDHDRQVIRDWNRDHQNAVNQFLGSFGMRIENGDLDRRLQVGNTVDPDLQQHARPAPDDLVHQLSVPPRGWHYVVIGDRLCLLDRDWQVRESYHFQH